MSNSSTIDRERFVTYFQKIDDSNKNTKICLQDVVAESGLISKPRDENFVVDQDLAIVVQAVSDFGIESSGIVPVVGKGKVARKQGKSGFEPVPRITENRNDQVSFTESS